MNWRRILVVIAWLSALAVVVEAGTIWVCMRSTWTPIQRHYLPAYIWCSLPVSTVEVRLLWKTGPHRKRELATEDDVTDSDGGTGILLSKSALDAGWKQLLEGPPQPVWAEKFGPALAVLAFDGEDLWDFLLLPEISALAVFCFALFGWFVLSRLIQALIADYAWRRHVSTWREVAPILLADCVALAQALFSELAALRSSASRRIAPHRPAPLHRRAPRTEIMLSAGPVRPRSFAIPIFGVYNGSGEGYLWSEKDEIE
ncbi:MAG TPA: hypothetical protein VGI45_14040 [Terracidiphilus sp.]|jgi:hypothetical protein